MNIKRRWNQMICAFIVCLLGVALLCPSIADASITNASMTNASITNASITNASTTDISTTDTSTTERQMVRVGYYPVSDYQEVREDGTYSGFSYDYYIQIQKYTRWQYEFVEASYAECMQMLMNGEIDVMSGLTESQDSDAPFIYSDYSNSNTQFKLYARKDDANLYYESFDTFDGCKVGMVEGVKSDELEQYANEHHFSVEIVKYSSYAEMEAALDSKAVDMLCGASLSSKAETKIVARMKKQPLYYAVTKSKPEIAEALNDALQKIIDNNPEFYAQMSEKYKIMGANAAATFTREETAYINSGKQIYLVVNNDLPPISWLDEKTGEYKGISMDVVVELEKYSGLNIQPITGEAFDELVKENPDIMGDALVMSPDDTAWANSMSIMMTNHVINATIVMVSKNGKSVDVTQKGTVVALPENFYLTYCLKDMMPDKDVQYYDTVQECLDAVNNGKADVTFQNSLVARYYLSMLKYTNLYIYAESGYSENLSYGVYIDSDTPLLSILDKSLLCIGAARINEIVIQYAHAEEALSLDALYYSNPSLVLCIVFIFCALIGLIIYFRLKAVNAVKEGKKEKILARFMGYVCAANEEVLEVNLSNCTAQSYTLNEDGKVTIQEMPYRYIHGDNYNKQIYPEDYGILIDHLKESALDEMIDHGGGEQYFECRAKNPEGVYQWYAYSLQAIPKDQEHPRNFILFKRDIDHVKKAEEERRKILEDALETAKNASEAKDLFLSRMSHELRTPLNAINGYASVIEQNMAEHQYDEEKTKSYVESILKAGKYQLAIIGDLLDIQKIESGKMELVPVEVDSSDYIKNIVVMIGPEAREKGIQFTYERLNPVNDTYLLDGVRFEQVLLNLLHNAIKFTSKGGKVRLTSEVINRGEEINILKFVITDTGIGMSEAFQQNYLFNRFAQEYKGNTSPYEGCGTGLAISRDIMHLMGGEITCESKQGEGSTFTVILPAKHIGKKRRRRKTVDYAQYDLSGMRILLCEDNQMNQDMERSLLEKMNSIVDIADDGQIGVDMFARSPEGFYGVVLMDIRMPNMDGLQAAKAMRSMDRKDAKTIPIFAVSANSFPEDVQNSLDAGMNEHLAKPVDMKLICEKIKEYCKV